MTQLDDASLFNKNMHILSQNLPCIFMFKPFWKDTVKNYASKKMFIPISFGNSAGSIQDDRPMQNTYFEACVRK